MKVTYTLTGTGLTEEKQEKLHRALGGIRGILFELERRKHGTWSALKTSIAAFFVDKHIQNDEKEDKVHVTYDFYRIRDDLSTDFIHLLKKRVQACSPILK